MTMYSTVLRWLADELDRRGDAVLTGPRPFHRSELAAALRAGSMALLGTHPAIVLRVRFVGEQHSAAEDDSTIYEANSDVIHTVAELAPSAPGGWVPVIEAIQDPTGRPFLHVEVRPVDLVSHPEELARVGRTYQDVGELRERMAARSG